MGTAEEGRPGLSCGEVCFHFFFRSVFFFKFFSIFFYFLIRDFISRDHFANNYYFAAHLSNRFQGAGETVPPRAEAGAGRGPVRVLGLRGGGRGREEAGPGDFTRAV